LDVPIVSKVEKVSDAAKVAATAPKEEQQVSTLCVREGMGKILGVTGE